MKTLVIFIRSSFHLDASEQTSIWIFLAIILYNFQGLRETGTINSLTNLSVFHNSMLFSFQLKIVEIKAKNAKMALNSKKNDFFSFESKDFLSNCASVYQEMRKSGKLCDIQIILKNQTIKAHQVILVGAIP